MKLGILLILYLIERTNKFHVLGTIIEEVVTSRQQNADPCTAYYQSLRVGPPSYQHLHR
jgi:hypothetical protein